jgi:uronate dehydrogenase
MTKPFRRLLLTGAAGQLGVLLREAVKPWADIVRLSDLAPMAPAGEGEEVVQCDLADRAAVLALVDGVDAVLHFGGVSVETPFAPILQANILGVANLYEAVHRHGVRRVVFASSNHAIGMYRTTERIDADMPLRPDGYYGVSKCFGESLSRYYFDRFGIETVCLRIGSCCPAPKTVRMLSTWCSFADLVELLRCSLFMPRVGHTIAFGVSDNPGAWWDNSAAGHLGYRPRDSSTAFAELFPDSGQYPDPDDLPSQYHGGPFVTAGPQYPSP